jgi:membrane protein
VGQRAIGLYLGQSSLAFTFGAAGSLVVLLVWACYSAQIVLLGEFTHAFADSCDSRQAKGPRFGNQLPAGVQKDASNGRVAANN